MKHLCNISVEGAFSKPYTGDGVEGGGGDDGENKKYYMYKRRYI